MTAAGEEVGGGEETIGTGREIPGSPRQIAVKTPPRIVRKKDRYGTFPLP